jgi:ketosteroid isomerase-like protein
MSSANLDIVRSMYSAWGRGDISWTDLTHPEMELVIADGPLPGSWTGLDEVREFSRDFLSAWEEFRFEVKEYRELDPERVLVLLERSGRGNTSGLELAQMRTKGVHVVHVRDGKVTRLVGFWDRDRGLADLGLAPETD